jgi:peptidoglycan hydrolase-like protein with peptidoglycan-binding domain
MRPIKESNLKTLRRDRDKGDEVVFLHSLLNRHLGPLDDQLPLEGSGAADFGQRTEKKVKKFQQLNRIDIGTRFFMDGVVGAHTWAKLLENSKPRLPFWQLRS